MTWDVGDSEEDNCYRSGHDSAAEIRFSVRGIFAAEAVAQSLKPTEAVTNHEGCIHV